MGISVSIIASDSMANSSVTASGSVRRIITNDDIRILKLEGVTLYNAVNAWGSTTGINGYVANVFFHDPTIWNYQNFAAFGWPQTQMVIQVINTEIISLDLQPIVMASTFYENNLSSPATFNANLTDSVSETVVSSWSSTHGFESSQTISHSVDFAGANIGGETQISFENIFGQGASESKQVTVSTFTGVSFILQTSQKARADMSGNKGTLKVRLTYEVSFTGGLLLNYNPTVDGHHFYYADINAVLKAGNIPASYQITEDIEIGYYADAKIVVTNL